MNWKGLIRDRRVQLGGAAAAAAAGGWALYRRKHQAPAAVTDTGSDGSAAAPSAYVPGSFPDTSGTDVASWLGQQIPAIESEVQDYIASHPTTPGSPPPTTTPSPTPAPKPVPKPVPSPRPAPGPVGKFVKVEAYTDKNPPWQSTLSGIAGHFKTTVPALLKLNPSIKNANQIRAGQEIRYQ